MKVLGAAESLGQQLGTDDLAITLDQTSVSLTREQKLSQSPDQHRINAAHYDTKHDGGGDRSPELFEKRLHRIK